MISIIGSYYETHKNVAVAETERAGILERVHHIHVVCE